MFAIKSFSMLFCNFQAHGVTFNRGALLNIGFLEAKKRDNFDCFIFHDVDLLPEDTRNLYSCTKNPRHMSSAIDVFQYRYCRFGNFRENFIFANSIKRHISDVKNSRLRQDLPISINDRVILPFREGFIFTKIKSSRKFPNLQ